jgi:hypothetical protein
LIFPEKREMFVLVNAFAIASVDIFNKPFQFVRLMTRTQMGEQQTTNGKHIPTAKTQTESLHLKL